ncbi:endonuclease/exonuclease/phosphatase family protein [Oerskovia turbata]
MRLVTFNILHGRSVVDGRVDVGRFARAVTGLEADVLALQEVDRNRSRSGRVDLAGVAAEAMGAVDHRFAPTVTGWGPRGRSEYGVALLSRFPVLEWRVLALPRRSWWRPLGWDGGHGGGRGRGRPGARWRVDEPRVAMVAVVDAPQGRLTVVATHLSFLGGWGERQLDGLARGLAGAPRPLVLLGDLNLRSRVPETVTGWRSLATALTYPAARPTLQIDHVLADGGVRALSPGWAVDTGVSDHRAVVVDVEIDRG